jgi:hypothetical protein
MPAWKCPECGRQFARVRQGHECSPAMSLDEYFSTGPPHERPVFDAIMARLDDIGPIHVEPVSVGIFLKRARSFAELRPRERWVAVTFSLPRREQHRTITRKVMVSGGQFWHVANVRGPEDVDDALGDLLVEAYFSSPEP